MSDIDHLGGEAAGAHLNNSDNPPQHQTASQKVLQGARKFYKVMFD
jgi:hypothetical protein